MNTYLLINKDNTTYTMDAADEQEICEFVISTEGKVVAYVPDDDPLYDEALAVTVFEPTIQDYRLVGLVEKEVILNDEAIIFQDLTYLEKTDYTIIRACEQLLLDHGMYVSTIEKRQRCRDEIREKRTNFTNNISN